MTQAQTSGSNEYYAFWQTIMGREHILLQVRACRDALVLLASSPFVFEDGLELHLVTPGKLQNKSSHFILIFSTILMIFVDIFQTDKSL